MIKLTMSFETGEVQSVECENLARALAVLDMHRYVHFVIAGPYQLHVPQAALMREIQLDIAETG